ncbi:MAG: ChaN family lipoprotein, partial [Gammaproteobacteria bacterium]|nr:ChaN family lipoprotein [Gammaproteobacteria bacterium]
MAAGSGVFDLGIGDSERKGRHASVVLDGITDTGTGHLLTPVELAERLADTRILFIGEDHTDMDFHRVQARILEELHRAGREVMIGLEMYPYTRQASLNDWSAGSLTEEEFVESSDWYENWGYRWDYYRRIFLFARDNGIPMFGVNVPRNYVRTVRTEGFEGLSAEQAAHMPETVNTDSDEHRQLFRAYFAEDDALHAAISDEQWE